MLFDVIPDPKGRDGIVAVRFPSDPGPAVRRELKDSRFGWSRRYSCWIGGKDRLPARYRLEHDLEPIRQPTPITPTSRQELAELMNRMDEGMNP